MTPTCISALQGGLYCLPWRVVLLNPNPLIANSRSDPKYLGFGFSLFSLLCILAIQMFNGDLL